MWYGFFLTLVLNQKCIRLFLKRKISQYHIIIQMLEKQVQSKVVKKLKESGWMVVKIMSCSLPGWPDLQALKNGKVIFIEVKAPGNVATPLQRVRHDQLRQAGFDVYVIDDVKKLEVINS